MRRLIPIVAAAIAAGCGGDGGGDEIAYTVNRDGYGEIWVMDADGSDPRRLTKLAPADSDAAGSTSPAWSPDGKRIAYAAQTGTLERPEEAEIYVMDADGTEPTRLTWDRDLNTSPVWSPDGERIAFVRVARAGPENPRSGIFVMSVDGSDEKRLTSPVRPTLDWGPAWSPDGSEVAFARVTPSLAPLRLRPSLYLVDVETRTERALGEEGSQPAWSPDGERIAFVSYRDGFGTTCYHECGPSGEIYVLDLEEGGVQRLTRSAADEHSPEWSPDGRSIAFVSDRSNREKHKYEIYVMSSTGEDVRRLTENDVWDLDPAWRR